MSLNVLDTKKYVRKSSVGAVVMNGKAIYNDSDIAYHTYHENNKTKRIDFTYTPDSNGCLKGNLYKIVIIIE
ncbi:MAG: hypothetical protein LBS55_13995 [Prevotellaceae bacterium]|nr:hypothetical protein [Prevotellaceae bacterium]